MDQRAIVNKQKNLHYKLVPDASDEMILNKYKKQ